ncbi:stalk domain-containing protein [Paenibacillus bovis]|uniref:Copper amine oxidase-like N-terminal domain-containing protein n=1 Tax=Paenibacillus bovis TaxID=1616788 RepID=A0A172ZEK1_9BACL|nr:stalk domain-containing protein [Paenibacillus bovis]ANF95792.1 hypothetical protein AR543_07090 [Paenibacillus bovis]
MNKAAKALTSILLAISTLAVSWNHPAAAAASSDPFVQKAKSVYAGTLTRSSLLITGPSAKEKVYSTIYIPVKDIFKGYADQITWDSKRKIAIVKKGDSEMILNFSDQSISSSDHQIVLPESWVKMQNGAASINALVLSYVFDRYGESYNDLQREQWKEKLYFLDIQYVDPFPGGKDGIMHVNVTYNS